MPRITEYDVRCTGCGEIVRPEGPKRERLFGIVSALLLGTLGGGVGAVIGIASAGFGMPAILPLGLLGLYFGWKMGAWLALKLDSISCPECGNEFGTSRLKSLFSRGASSAS